VRGKTGTEEKSVLQGAGRIDRRRARTRRALLDAAETLFAAQGVDAVSIDEIANLADVAKGTFYNYFIDKDTLAQELSDTTRLELEAAIGALNAAIDDAAVRLARALCWVLQYGLANPDRARTMMRMHPHATDPEAPLNSGVRADMRGGLSTRRFAASSEAASVVFTVGVVQAGLSRTLDGLDAASVATLGYDLGLLLLRGLGVADRDAVQVMGQAVAAVFGHADPAAT
jgi:AcrR family transcriptional regulator